LILTTYDSENYIKFISNNITFYPILPVNIDLNENEVIKILKEQGIPELDSEFNCNYLFPVYIENKQASLAGSAICKPIRFYNRKSNSIKIISENQQLFLIVKSSDLEDLRNTFNASTNS
ncbi:hypothetical protein NC990_21895, partial [Funiculus sociatus GB2-M1]